MLTKIKNISNSTVAILDLGISVASNGYYDLANKKYSTSEDLINQIALGTIAFIKYESPEELYSNIESIQFATTGSIIQQKTSISGENITLKNEYGHLQGNNIINWMFNKYLDNDESFSEKMYIPIESTITLNSFSIGSFNVSTSGKLEYFEWNTDFNEFIRLNRDIRIDEYYISNMTSISDSSNFIVSNINSFEAGLVYQIETVDNSELYRRVISVDTSTSTISFNVPVPEVSNISIDAKISLVDRPLAENNSQLSNNNITWISPLRISGHRNGYIEITITNEDDSEPGQINSAINGWIGNL